MKDDLIHDTMIDIFQDKDNILGAHLEGRTIESYKSMQIDKSKVAPILYYQCIIGENKNEPLNKHIIIYDTTTSSILETGLHNVYEKDKGTTIVKIVDTSEHKIGDNVKSQTYELTNINGAGHLLFSSNNSGTLSIVVLESRLAISIKSKNGVKKLPIQDNIRGHDIHVNDPNSYYDTFRSIFSNIEHGIQKTINESKDIRITQEAKINGKTGECFLFGVLINREAYQLSYKEQNGKKTLSSGRYHKNLECILITVDINLISSISGGIDSLIGKDITITSFSNDLSKQEIKISKINNIVILGSITPTWVTLSIKCNKLDIKIKTNGTTSINLFKAKT